MNTRKPKKPVTKNGRVQSRRPQEKTDMEQVRRLFEVLSAELGDQVDPVEMFISFIDQFEENDIADKDLDELGEDLLSTLTELRIDANGGDPEARTILKEIYAVLDEGIVEDRLGPVLLIVVGKLFSDAELPVHDNVREALGKVLNSLDLEDGDLRKMLPALDDGLDPFDLYENMRSLFAAIPSEFLVRMVMAVLHGQDRRMDEAAIGFFLHPDDNVAQAISEALVAKVASASVSYHVMERLDRLRSWLTPQRQAWLDKLVEAMRANALPPVRKARVDVLELHMSVCDGSGASALSAGVKTGSRYAAVNLMIRSTGIADVVINGDIMKPMMTNMLRLMSMTTTTFVVDLPCAREILAFALGRNMTHGIMPPFRLLQFMDILGIDQLNPDRRSLDELFSDLLKGLPAAQTDNEARARAQHNFAHLDYCEGWFEAGEEVDRLLSPKNSRKKRIELLLGKYLPGRRDFWAGQCAYMALLMKNSREASEEWLDFALVGQSLARGDPLEPMQLMQQIADMTIQVREYRL